MGIRAVVGGCELLESRHGPTGSSSIVTLAGGRPSTFDGPLVGVCSTIFEDPLQVCAKVFVIEVGGARLFLVESAIVEVPDCGYSTTCGAGSAATKDLDSPAGLAKTSLCLFLLGVAMTCTP